MSVGNLIEARGGHTATLLNDGTVLAAGGIQFPSGQVLYTAENFFPDLGGCGQTFARLTATATRVRRRILARRRR
jgi:hypothetical protein